MNTNYFLSIILGIPAILIATTAHEFTRAVVSTYFGDTLPKNNKKLTGNPLRYFEPIGFILMMVTGGFGWGRPVETSALYYKNRKRDTLITAIVPSVINLILAVLAIFFIRLLGNTMHPYVYRIVDLIAYYNVGLFVFNLLPVVPMDCVKVLSVVMPANKYFQYMQYEKMIQMGFLLLLFFGVFQSFFQILISVILNVLNAILFFI